MPFCIRCSPIDCGVDGLISISMSPASNVRYVDDDECSSGLGSNPALSETFPEQNTITEVSVGTGGVDSDVDTGYIPGPAKLNVTINAYAFSVGSDKWLGSRCKGTAQASQTNHTRYDSVTDKWYIIPSRNHTASIQGDPGSAVSLGKIFFEGSTANSQILNNTSITTELGIQIGAELSYSGFPLSVTVPNMQAYRLTGIGESGVGFLTGVSLNVDYPQSPATISYSFEFMLE